MCQNVCKYVYLCICMYVCMYDVRHDIQIPFTRYVAINRLYLLSLSLFLTIHQMCYYKKSAMLDYTNDLRIHDR